jgi:phage shock protein C
MSSVYRKLYRSRQERMIAGVCGGLGEYFGIDPTLMRLIFVVAGLFSGPMAVIAYVIFMIVVPEEPLTRTAGTVSGVPEEPHNYPATPIVSVPGEAPEDTGQA